MSAFEYVGFDSAGRRCRGIIDARDMRDTRKLLAEQGILADKIHETRKGRESSIWRSRPGIDVRIHFYEELGSLLGAGVPMSDALSLLFGAPDSGVAPRVVAGIRDGIRDGMPLAVAMNRVYDDMPAFETAVLEAGQRAGALPRVLEQLAGFLQTQRDLSETVRSAMVYPSFVVGFAVFMILGLIGFGLPAVGRLLEGTGVALPWLIRWTLRWGAGSVVGILLALLVVVTGLSLVLARTRRAPRGRLRLERILFSLPLIGMGYAILVNLRFVRTLEILINGGHPLVDSLALAGVASGSQSVADDMAMAADRLRHGGCSLTEAVALSTPLAAGSVPAWIRTGEAAGALGIMLGRLADRLDQRWERFTKRALDYLMPIVILFVGAFVLAATLSILLPVLNLNQMLLQ